MGGLFSGIGKFLFGEKDKIKQLPTQNPQQQQGLSQIFSQLNQMGQPGGNFSRAQNYLGSILNGDPETMNNFSAPYIQNFEQQIVPRLAERFAGLGGGLGGGVGSSSGFGQAIGGAGAGLQSQLAGLFANLQRGAASDVNNQYNSLSALGLGTPTFENIYQRGNTGVAGAAAAGLAGGLGQAGGFGALSQLFNMINGNRSSGPQQISATGPYGGGSSYDPYSGYQGGQFYG